MTKYKVLLASVFSLTMSVNVNAALIDGLIGYYGFENDLADSSGLGQEGALSGSIKYTTGAYGQGANINGFVTAEIEALPTGAASRTISAWALMTSGNESDEDQYVAGYGDNPSVDNSLFAIAYGLGDDDYDYGAWLAGCDYDVSCESGLSGQIANNSFYNIVISYDAPSYTTSIFVNGNLYDQAIRDESTEPATQTTTSNFFIGGWYGNQFNGVIDEVGIWDRSLSEEEIQKLYLNPNAVFAEVPEPSVIFLFGIGLAGMSLSRRKK